MRTNIPNKQGVAKGAMMLLLVLVGISVAWAQSAINDIPKEIKASDATITQMGHATLTLRQSIVVDSVSGRVDTLRKVTNVEWHTEPGTAKRRMAEQRDGGSGFYDHDSDWWLDLHWYTYNYPSVDEDGNYLLLSSMACMPDNDCRYVNNVIIACHVTLTDNDQCPSMYNTAGSAASDVSILMNHASSGLVIHSAQSDMPYYNLVILPDYEGFGITRYKQEPYLYQELTARHVVDATRYGIALYQSDPQVNGIRHPFRDGWRSISLGYSQGGAVALGVQRFIEQNDLSEELHLAGSVCGGGPYDLMTTILYYVDRDNQGEVLSMPVVMPIVLKALCDFNPYMKNHHPEDYFVERFLETGILTWLSEKSKTTDEITETWKSQYESSSYFHSVLTAEGKAKLSNIMKPEVLAYLRALLADNPSYATTPVPLPTRRGLNEDLHFAMESNSLVRGWQPQHAMFLYHSYVDTVVPESNRTSASTAFGEWVIKLHASIGGLQSDHVPTGLEFLFGTEEFNAIRALSAMPYIQTLDDVRTAKNNYSQSSLDN